jgi:hypothetical protein
MPSFTAASIGVAREWSLPAPMEINMQTSRQLIIIIGILFLIAGCDYMPFGYTPIGEINRSPGRFEGKEIRVRGTVTNLNKLPFLEIKIYTLRDETGEITVFTESTLPAMGETIGVKVAVKTTAIVGEQSYGLRLEEIKKLPAF